MVPLGGTDRPPLEIRPRELGLFRPYRTGCLARLQQWSVGRGGRQADKTVRPRDATHRSSTRDIRRPRSRRISGRSHARRNSCEPALVSTSQIRRCCEVAVVSTALPCRLRASPLGRCYELAVLYEVALLFVRICDDCFVHALSWHLLHCPCEQNVNESCTHTFTRTQADDDQTDRQKYRQTDRQTDRRL